MTEPTVILRRVYMIGDADQIALDPDGAKAITGYESTILLGAASELVAADRVREPPSACGEKIGQVYLDSLVGRFKVNALNSCKMSNHEVSCRSDYLPAPYVKAFLSLRYQHIPAKHVKVILEVLQREKTGRLSASQMKEDDRTWFNDLYRQLSQMAYCR